MILRSIDLIDIPYQTLKENLTVYKFFIWTLLVFYVYKGIAESEQKGRKKDIH